MYVYVYIYIYTYIWLIYLSSCPNYLLSFRPPSRRAKLAGPTLGSRIEVSI